MNLKYITWVFMLIIAGGIVMCFMDLNNNEFFNKYEGITLITVGFIISCAIDLFQK